LKAKGKTFEKFKQYKVLVENKIGHKIKVLRSDNGGEFASKKFDTFLVECGIQRQTSAPYSSQQNGVMEHANRTIMECARSMILAQGLKLCHARMHGLMHDGRVWACPSYLLRLLYGCKVRSVLK